MDDHTSIAPLLQQLNTSHRPLRLRLSLPDGIRDDVLLPHQVNGIAAICEGIDMRIYCVALDACIPLKTFIGVPAELQIVTDQGNLRSICGIVTEASQGESDGGLATYQLVIRDALAILDLDLNTRVFVNTTELEAVQTVLREARNRIAGLAIAFDMEVDQVLAIQEHPRRAQIIQHNESTAAFVRRLLKRRGISWYFRAGLSRANPDRERKQAFQLAHTIVLFHDTRLLGASPAGEVRFHRDSATEERDTVTAWSGARTLRPGQSSRFSWDYRNPSSPGFRQECARTATDQGKSGNSLAAGLEHYLVEGPHIGDNARDFQSLTLLRQARADFESKCFHAEGGLRDIGPGEYFRLDGHPELDLHPENERQFVVIAQHISARNNLPKELDARVDRLFAMSRWNIDILPFAAAMHGNELGESRFFTRLTCIRRGVRFVPAYDPRTDLPHPQMQSAIVAGPSGEEVCCDELGRVKVHFTGTMARDENAKSAWVRVASSWAGNIGNPGHGLLSLPRAGTEVLLAFLGGDPDKPIIIAQLYNAQALPPRLGAAGLPENRYLSGLKSREIKGERANQLRFDDTAGQISTQLASEHGASELNLGWLTQPRDSHQVMPRGEGAELRTEAHLALRAGKGMLLTAWQRLSRNDKQLERSEYLTLMEACLELFRTLGQHAAEHQALPLDVHAQEELASAFKRGKMAATPRQKAMREERRSLASRLRQASASPHRKPSSVMRRPTSTLSHSSICNWHPANASISMPVREFPCLRTTTALRPSHISASCWSKASMTTRTSTQPSRYGSRQPKAS